VSLSVANCSALVEILAPFGQSRFLIFVYHPDAVTSCILLSKAALVGCLVVRGQTCRLLVIHHTVTLSFVEHMDKKPPQMNRCASQWASNSLLDSQTRFFSGFGQLYGLVIWLDY
jgi:hypothetical protein